MQDLCSGSDGSERQSGRVCGQPDGGGVTSEGPGCLHFHQRWADPQRPLSVTHPDSFNLVRLDVLCEKDRAGLVWLDFIFAINPEASARIRINPEKKSDFNLFKETVVWNLRLRIIFSLLHQTRRNVQICVYWKCLARGGGPSKQLGRGLDKPSLCSAYFSLKETDWSGFILTSRKQFKVELLKMDVWEFRLKISAILLRLILMFLAKGASFSSKISLKCLKHSD